MPRRKLTKPTLKEYNGANYDWAVYYNRDGNRVRSLFATKQEAKIFLADKEAEAERLGGEIAAALSDDLKREVVRLMRKLEPYDRTLDDAVTHYVKYLEATMQSRPIGELVDEYLLAMEKAGKSERYLQELKNRLGHFTEKFLSEYASTIGTKDAQSWLNKRHGSEQTINNYRRVLSAFFSWCERFGYVQENPILKTTKAKAIGGDIEIFKVDELRVAMLHALKTGQDDIFAYICIGAFAGLRAEEINRLKWEDVKVGQDHINLSHKITKTAARRIVDMQPVLRQWMDIYGKTRGPLRKRNWVKRLKQFRDELAAGDEETGRKPQKWPFNGLRHSYASYLLALKNDPGYVSLQLGHNDSGIVFKHYREIVTRTDAESYWNLTPEKVLSED